MQAKLFVRLALVLGIPVLGALGVEAVARWGLFSLVAPGFGQNPVRIQAYREFVAGRDTGLYEPRAYVGFTLNTDSPGINSRGFRDEEFRLERTPGVRRIACLGASTTEGSMAEGGGSFPLHLRRLFQSEKQLEVEVYNFGVSGWTSAESLANYCLCVQDYSPDLVIIHHSINDVRPRLWPNFRSDYSHYRRPWKSTEFGALERFLIEYSTAYTAILLRDRQDWNLGALVNVPLPRSGSAELSPPSPKTAEAFIRNIRSIVQLVRANGATPLLTTIPLAADSPFYANPFGQLVKQGVTEHNQLLRELAAEQDVPLLDFEEIWRSDPDTYAGHFIDHVHVTSHGNRLKARNIIELLEEDGLAGILQ